MIPTCLPECIVQNYGYLYMPYLHTQANLCRGGFDDAILWFLCGDGEFEFQSLKKKVCFFLRLEMSWMSVGVLSSRPFWMPVYPYLSV